MSGDVTGVELIARERTRQLTIKGWSPEHDDEHDGAQISFAASCYAHVSGFLSNGTELDRSYGGNAVLRSIYLSDEIDPRRVPRWPWGDEWWKPSDDPIRNLEKAGALIAAEIDRLLRLQVTKGAK